MPRVALDDMLALAGITAVGVGTYEMGGRPMTLIALGTVVLLVAMIASLRRRR